MGEQQRNVNHYASPAIDRSHLIAFLFSKHQNPTFAGWGLGLLRGSLTITYFHTGIRTIIGVESFHGPVRDGKGWDRLAMVIRHEGLLCRGSGATANPGRSRVRGGLSIWVVMAAQR